MYPRKSRLLLFCAVLLTVMAAGGTAQAADGGDGNPHLTANLTARFVYCDMAATKSCFYEVWPDGADGRSYSVTVDSNGDWHRLPDAFGSMYAPEREGELPRIAIGIQPYSDFYVPRYDAASNTVVYARDARTSPNGRWSLTESFTFEKVPGQPHAGPTKRVNLLLKNNANGKLVDWKESDTLLNAGWLSDNTVVSRGSASFPVRQGVVRHDPLTGRTTDLTQGSYPVASTDGTKVLFYRTVRHDLGSILMIYDVATGQERRGVYPDDHEKLLSRPDPHAEAAPAFPSVLHLADIPVLTPAVAYTWEHDVVLNERRVPVPYAVLYRGQAYVPLRFLLDRGVVELSQKNDMTELRRGNRTVQVDGANSRQYGMRVYVQAALLRKLGYAHVAVEPHRPASTDTTAR